MSFFEKFANKVNERVKQSEEEIKFRNFEEVVAEERGVKEEPEEAPATEISANPTSSGAGVNLKFAKPSSYDSEEVSEIAEFLLSGYIVVLDVSDMSRGDVIRLLDFLNGVTYVTDGTITQRNQKTFVITPKNVNITD